MAVELPEARSVAVNPTQDELRGWVDEMPTATRTEHGNYSVQTEVVARSAGSTYVVTDEEGFTSKQRMGRAEYDELAVLVRAMNAGQVPNGWVNANHPRIGEQPGDFGEFDAGAFAAALVEGAGTDRVEAPA